MAELKLRSGTGNYVMGELFWDREKELTLLMERLQENANILIAAPRRIGKTSLMREAAEKLKDNFICLHIDLQQSHSAAEAVAELSKVASSYKPLGQKVFGLFENILKRVTDNFEKIYVSKDIALAFRIGLNAGNWQEKGDQLFEYLANTDKPVILFLDEVPILVNRLLKDSNGQITADNKKETEKFLSWLRGNRTKHKNRVLQVITGSIGIEPILHQAGLSGHINDLLPFQLKAWSPEIAIGFLKAIADSYKLTFEQGTPEQIIRILGYCIPHHVQMFFSYIRNTCKLEGITDISASLVHRIYQEEMLSTRGHAELSHMEERLKLAFTGDTYLLTLALLTETSIHNRLSEIEIDKHANGYRFANFSRDEVVQEILGILIHDGYLIKNEDNTHSFISNLLRDWWKARFSAGFRPAAKRKSPSPTTME